jgi:recombination protein RecR
LHLLRRESADVERFARAMTELKSGIRACTTCHNLSDSDTCGVCNDASRDSKLVCVVETIRELLAVEATGQYRGVYHVLGGVISPVEGVGPGDLNITSLLARCNQGGVNEVIFALSTTMEGETTAFYLYRKLAPSGVKVSVIARGVALGDELQHADEVTLASSIIRRQPYEANLAR